MNDGMTARITREERQTTEDEGLTPAQIRMVRTMSSKDSVRMMTDKLDPDTLLELAEKYWPIDESKDSEDKKSQPPEERRSFAVQQVRTSAYAASVARYGNEPGTTHGTQIMRRVHKKMTPENISLAEEISMAPLEKWHSNVRAFLQKEQVSSKSRVAG